MARSKSNLPGGCGGLTLSTQDVVVVEAGVDPHQADEAADEEAGADEQHRPPARPPRRRARRAAAASMRPPSKIVRCLSARVRQIGARRLQRRDDAEEEPAQSRGADRGEQHAQVDPDRGDARQAGRQPGANAPARRDTRAGRRSLRRRSRAGVLRPADRGRAASGWPRVRRGCPSRVRARSRARASGSRRWRTRSAAPARRRRAASASSRARVPTRCSCSVITRVRRPGLHFGYCSVERLRDPVHLFVSLLKRHAISAAGRRSGRCSCGCRPGPCLRS